MQDGDFTLDLFGRSGIIAVTPKESALTWNSDIVWVLSERKPAVISKSHCGLFYVLILNPLSQRG
jgi:hypothetical protein